MPYSRYIFIISWFIFCGSSGYFSFSSFIWGCSFAMRFMVRVDLFCSGHIKARMMMVKATIANPHDHRSEMGSKTRARRMLRTQFRNQLIQPSMP